MLLYVCMAGYYSLSLMKKVTDPLMITKIGQNHVIPHGQV
jgi:hypothetical protein